MWWEGEEDGIGLADKIHLEFVKVVVWGLSLPQTVMKEEGKLEKKGSQRDCRGKKQEKVELFLLQLHWRLSFLFLFLNARNSCSGYLSLFSHILCPF
jgi:hypothetical protein